MSKFDLQKAKRDRSKLVLVQRMVSRGGKVFPQNFLVRPDKVLPTDRILGGQDNLLDPQKPKQGELSQVYFDSIKGNKLEALSYLIESGVTWVEDIDPAINWMRAMSSYTKALNQPYGVVLLEEELTKIGEQKTSKDKVVYMKEKIGIEKTIEFAKQLGVVWKKSRRVPVNILRMSIALEEYFEEGGELAPTGLLNVGSGGNNGGAPLGNQNAKKDESLIEVPSDATQREINLITLINNMTDIGLINSCETIGMVPEDRASELLVIEKFLPGYTGWKEWNDKKLGTGVRSYSSTFQFQNKLSEIIPLKGISTKNISDYSFFSVLLADNFVGSVFTPSSTYSYKKITLEDTHISGAVVGKLELFKDLSTYDYLNVYSKNSGYSGESLKKARESFDIEKEGMFHLLKKIGEDQPELKAETATMITEYSELMEMVSGDTRFLEFLLESSDWTTNIGRRNPLENFENFGMTRNYLSTRVNPVVVKESVEALEDLQKKFDKTMETLDLPRHTLELLVKNREFSGSWNISFDEIILNEGSSSTILNLLQVTDELTGEVLLPRRVPADVCAYLLKNYLIKSKDADLVDGASFETKHLDSGVQRMEGKLEFAEAVSRISFEELLDIKQRAERLFGKEYRNDAGFYPTDKFDDSINFLGDYYLQPALTTSVEREALLGNIELTLKILKMNSGVSSYIQHFRKSKANRNGLEMSKNFDWFSANKTPIHSYFKNPSNEEIAKELPQIISRQIEELPTFSLSYFEKALDYYKEKDPGGTTFEEFLYNEAPWKSFFVDDEYKFDGDPSPTTDLVYDILKVFTAHMPMLSKSKGEKLLEEAFDYERFDGVKKVKPNDKKVLDDYAHIPEEHKALREARELLFKAANCSFAAVTSDEFEELRTQFFGKFDYSRRLGEKKLYDGSDKGSNGGQFDRRILLESLFFKINNSNMEEPYKKYAEKLQQEPQELYHGTSYGSAAGILGVSGGWKKKIGAKAGRMLGDGAYFGRRVGKVLPYIGTEGYAYHAKGVSGTKRAEGIVVISDVIRGKKSKSSKKPYVDSVTDKEAGANGIRDYELVVKNNDCILPKYFVAASARALGVNVTRDAEGNYYDENGVMTHNKHGVKLDLFEEGTVDGSDDNT